MLAKLRQAGHLLRHGELHVMSRNALMIGRGLIIDQPAMRKIGRGDADASRTLAVGRAGLIVRGGARLKRRNGFDRHRRAGNVAEQFRQLRLHLRDVLAEIIENLLGRSRDVLGIGLQRIAERGDIVEALLARDDQHFAFDAIDLAQADRVNLVRGQGADGGAAADVVEVALLAAGQRGHAQGCFDPTGAYCVAMNAANFL